MIRKREDIRLALDTALSGASHDPALFNRIVNASKGDAPPVKRKLTLSMALVLLLVLITCTMALAAAYRGVSYFMFERYGDPVSLDEDYLLSGIQQSHSNPLVNISVVDAYWDGVDLSIAYHVSPVDPGHFIRVDCEYPAHDHYRPIESADIQMYSVDGRLITITDNESGEVARPHHCSSNWVYEDDGSLSVFNSFTLNSMSESASVSIPISLMLIDTGEVFDSVLLCQLPVLSDPIAEHEHDWLPATCWSPQICAICQRSEGDLGDHDFQPSDTFKELSVCTVCSFVRNWHQGIPADVVFRPGDSHEYVQVLQWHLKERGYLPRIVTNSYDEPTMEAVKAFQESQGLPADGICDSETLKKLFP